MFTVSGETSLLRPCTWSHMSTVFSVTPSRPGTGVTFPVSSVIPLHKHCIWAHTSTVSSVTPPHQTFYLSLLGLSLQGYPISQTLYLGSHTHGGQDDNLPQRLYLMSHGHSHQGYPNFQTLYLGSHKYSLQGEPLTDTPPGVTYPQSPE